MKPKKGKNNRPSPAKNPDSPPSGQSIYYLSRKIRKKATPSPAIPLNKGNNSHAATDTESPSPGIIQSAMFNTSPEPNTPATAKHPAPNSIIQSAQNNAPAYLNGTGEGGKDKGSVLERVLGPAGKMMDMTDGDDADTGQHKIPGTADSAGMFPGNLSGSTGMNNNTASADSLNPGSPSISIADLTLNEGSSPQDTDIENAVFSVINGLSEKEFRASAGIKSYIWRHGQKMQQEKICING